MLQTIDEDFLLLQYGAIVILSLIETDAYSLLRILEDDLLAPYLILHRISDPI